MILITGATGHLGKAVVESLLTKTSPSNLSVLVRDPAKAAHLEEKGVEVRTGDYSDYASLVSAFKGVDKLYFVSGNDVVNRVQQHQNVVNAAKEARVKHVVYTSFQRKNETDTSPIALIAGSHIQTEKMLKASGLAYTILKHAIYMDMLPIFIGHNVVEKGTIFLPAGEGKASFASRADMAEAAATILTTAGHENKSYEIAGGTAYSYKDVAALLTSLHGKKINYVSPAVEIFQQELTKAGVPVEYVGLFAAFSEAMRQGEFDQTDDTLEKLLGRKPVALKEYLKSAFAAS